MGPDAIFSWLICKFTKFLACQTQAAKFIHWVTVFFGYRIWQNLVLFHIISLFLIDSSFLWNYFWGGHNLVLFIPKESKQIYFNGCLAILTLFTLNRLLVSCVCICILVLDISFENIYRKNLRFWMVLFSSRSGFFFASSRNRMGIANQNRINSVSGSGLFSNRNGSHTSFLVVSKQPALQVLFFNYFLN